MKKKIAMNNMDIISKFNAIKKFDKEAIEELKNQKQLENVQALPSYD